MSYSKSSYSQFGASIVETMLVFPVMFLMGLGIVHLGLVYQAKSNLEYAALMAARIGSVTSIDIQQMRNEVARRMAPSQIGPNAISPGAVEIEIINPTANMFSQCGQAPLDNTICNGAIAACEIPNFGLQYRSPTATNCGGGASLQDANLLRIKVTLLFDTKIPFMNMRLFAGDSRNQTPAGTNISAVATVRMQSPARMTFENEGYFL